MSQNLKPFECEPMGAFLMEEFITFARSWPHKKDLKKMAIELAPNGYPMVGNAQLLSVLFRCAVFPERLDPASEDARLFAVCYRRAPDFILALLVCLRAKNKQANATPHRKRILFEQGDNSPKGVMAGIREVVDYRAIKIERRRLRSVTEKVSRMRRDAMADQDSRISKASKRRRIKNSRVPKRRK